MVTLNGNDYLDDLAQAIADFHPGDTLEVSGSVTLTDTVVVDHPVVLTGVAPGATLTTAGPVGSMFFVNDSLQLAGLALAPVAATRAIDCADVASVTLTDVDIVGGSAENGGQVHATDCDVTFVRGTFSLGQAELGGSVFVGAGATLTVDGPASFEQNLAVRYANLPSGGAVFVSAGAATFTDVDFAENRSDEHAGGAIVAQYGGALHLTDVDFLSNHAGTDGGALLLWNGGVADMLRGSFDANDAEFGGAVSLANSGNGDSTFTATDVGFTNNSASLGGGDLAIHDDGDTATLSGVDSVGARSSEDGGAYWLDWGTLTVTGGTVRSPRATQDGALFEVEHGAVTVTRTVVCDPEAIDQDGAVVAGRSDSHTTLRNVTVRRAVGGRSGGLFSDGDASVVADHLTLVDAEADPGAVVYATGSSVATLTDALLVTSDLDPHRGGRGRHGLGHRGVVARPPRVRPHRGGGRPVPRARHVVWPAAPHVGFAAGSRARGPSAGHVPRGARRRRGRSGPMGRFGRGRVPGPVGLRADRPRRLPARPGLRRALRPPPRATLGRGPRQRRPRAHRGGDVPHGRDGGGDGGIGGDPPGGPDRQRDPRQGPRLWLRLRVGCPRLAPRRGPAGATEAAVTGLDAVRRGRVRCPPDPRGHRRRHVGRRRLPTYRGVGGLYRDVDTTEDGVPIEVALSGEMLRQRPEVTWRHLRRIESATRGARPPPRPRRARAARGPRRGHHPHAERRRSAPGRRLDRRDRGPRQRAEPVLRLRLDRAPRRLDRPRSGAALPAL
jgi:hypothetical protein